MTQSLKTELVCQPTANGNININANKLGKTKKIVTLAPDQAVALAATLLSTCSTAAKVSGQTPHEGPGQSLYGSLVMRPDKVGLSYGPGEPSVLVVHSGMAQFGIEIPKLRELGEAILAVTAPEDRSQ